jgi:CelD/BcsL family acetyltransferase involved in cellulose biosynthesis
VDVEIISDLRTFVDLESEWNALAERHATPLLRHEWFAAAFDAFGAGCDLAIHVVRDGERLRAIAPFIIEHGMMSRLALLGHQTFEPSGILHADDNALELVVHRLQAWQLPLFAPLLARGSAEVRALACGALWRPQLLQRLRSSASVPLGSNWPAFEAQMSKQSRTYIRRKRKAAEREGAVRVEVVAPLEEEVECHLAEFIRVEAAGWKSREGTSLQRNARMRRFYTSYVKAAARKTMLRMFFLRAGQHTIAVRMAVECGGHLWELKIGYDEKFSACSPGILLTHETLRWACERGLTAHEFLGSAEPWQRWWPLELRQYQNVRLYPFSIAGCVALGRDAGGMAARRLAMPLQAGIRRALRQPPATRSASRFHKMLSLSDRA